jgi:hypothetical protein
MALNFPSVPELNEIYSVGENSWQWDGIAWNLIAASTPTGEVIVTDISDLTDTSNIIPSDISDLTDTTNIIPDTLLDLNITDGSNGQVLATNGDGGFSFVTVTGGSGGAGEVNQNAFSSIVVEGQGTIQADAPTDSLNFQQGAGIQIATDSNTDTITITNTKADAASASSELTDHIQAGVTVDKYYEPAVAMFRVDNSGTSAYTFNSHYTGDNPTLYVISGMTYAFDLDGIIGHPFQLQDSTGTNLTTSNVIHVDTDGTVTTGADAQGKTSGTLYWRVQESDASPPNYRYQCSVHASMVGAIQIRRLSTI